MKLPLTYKKGHFLDLCVNFCLFIYFNCYSEFFFHKDKQFLKKTVKVDGGSNLLLKKDLLPTLKEVYQSFQLQTFKVYK